MTNVSPLQWATLGFTGLALATGDFAMVDFHSVSSILGAATVLFAGLAGLCLHPPWAPAASDSRGQIVPLPQPNQPPRPIPPHA